MAKTEISSIFRFARGFSPPHAILVCPIIVQVFFWIFLAGCLDGGHTWGLFQVLTLSNFPFPKSGSVRTLSHLLSSPSSSSFRPRGVRVRERRAMRKSVSVPLASFGVRDRSLAHTRWPRSDHLHCPPLAVETRQAQRSASGTCTPLACSQPWIGQPTVSPRAMDPHRRTRIGEAAHPGPTTEEDLTTAPRRGTTPSGCRTTHQNGHWQVCHPGLQMDAQICFLALVDGVWGQPISTSRQRHTGTGAPRMGCPL